MMSGNGLSGKCAIVTGGAGILGEAFCLGLAKANANVALVDLDQARVEKSVANIKRQNVEAKVSGFVCDVTNKSSITKMVNGVVDKFGKIDILHNNAATKGQDIEAFFQPFEEYSLEVWREIMSVNLDGMFLVAQAAGKQMIKQGAGGSIIQTSSIYAVVAPDQRIYEGSHYLGTQINTPAVYSASKAGVIGLTQYLAAYWADKNIRVNTLTPGGVSSGQNDTFQKKYSQRVPLARMAKKSEIVNALLFLASDASSYMTGQNIVVDGGLSCW